MNGEEITLTEFNNTQQVLYSNSGADIYNQRSYLWNYFVEKSIVKTESDALGLGVGDVELEDLQYGNNLGPIIRQQFQKPADRTNRPRATESDQTSDRVRTSSTESGNLLEISGRTDHQIAAADQIKYADHQIHFYTFLDGRIAA